jgi:hypothetical protein
MATVKASELVQGQEVERMVYVEAGETDRPTWVRATADTIEPHPQVVNGYLITWSDGKTAGYGADDTFVTYGEAPTVYHPHLLPHRDWREFRTLFRTGAGERSDIALLIWAVVAEFTQDTSPLVVPDGVEIWKRAEPYIREHAEAAEQATIDYNSRPDEVIMGVLAYLDLADDYLRIKRNEQHMAFEGGTDD